MASKAQQLYDAHHIEFEAWFSKIHPNNDLTFEWVTIFGSGWYTEDMANGAWITWLELTGKRKS